MAAAGCGVAGRGPEQLLRSQGSILEAAIEAAVRAITFQAGVTLDDFCLSSEAPPHPHDDVPGLSATLGATIASSPPRSLPHLPVRLLRRADGKEQVGWPEARAAEGLGAYALVDGRQFALGELLRFCGPLAPCGLPSRAIYSSPLRYVATCQVSASKAALNLGRPGSGRKYVHARVWDLRHAARCILLPGLVSGVKVGLLRLRIKVRIWDRPGDSRRQTGTLGSGAEVAGFPMDAWLELEGRGGWISLEGGGLQPRCPVASVRMRFAECLAVDWEELPANRVDHSLEWAAWDDDDALGPHKSSDRLSISQMCCISFVPSHRSQAVLPPTVPRAFRPVSAQCRQCDATLATYRRGVHTATGRTTSIPRA